MENLRASGQHQKGKGSLGKRWMKGVFWEAYPEDSPSAIQPLDATSGTWNINWRGTVSVTVPSPGWDQLSPWGKRESNEFSAETMKPFLKTGNTLENTCANFTGLQTRSYGQKQTRGSAHQACTHWNTNRQEWTRACTRHTPEKSQV